MDLDTRLKRVMADVFGISTEKIGENASIDTVSEWDSLNSMNLAVSLEDEFNVQFTDEELMDMLNYKIIRMTLMEKGIE